MKICCLSPDPLTDRSCSLAAEHRGPHEYLPPWHESLLCDVRGCRGPMVTVAIAQWNHRAKTGDRIVCCACGNGRVGTDEEVEQARAADAAWEASR